MYLCISAIQVSQFRIGVDFIFVDIEKSPDVVRNDESTHGKSRAH
jgi:hypothetical protein